MWEVESEMSCSGKWNAASTFPGDASEIPAEDQVEAETHRLRGSKYSPALWKRSFRA